MSTDAVGGVWTYAAELGAALAAVGVEVVLATLGPSPPPQAGVAYRRCRLEWQEEPWEDVRASGAWLRELAEDERVALVHLNGYAHGALPWHVPAVVVGHSCVLSWHEAVRGEPAGSPWRRYETAVAAGLRGADAVVAPTIAMRSALLALYGFDGDCCVIPNGVSPHPSQRDDAKRQLVLGAGRLWDEAKGLRTLDAAAGRIGWPVAVAGDAGGASARHVRLLGQLDRQALRARMGRAAIFAHPARYEPFGLVVLEAALAGCALVLGDIPSLREQWDGAALFVAPGDDAALAAALARLIDDGGLRGTLASRAGRRARRNDARTMAGAYAALYRRLAAHGCGRTVAA
ncbi:MAG: glycogen synthase [Solirubrobacteraceae bacterium]|nr:glycogen synthase [Solirubrobacteraceae bacterium]